MSSPENKRNLAPPKDSVFSLALQRIVSFAEGSKEKYQKAKFDA